MPLLTLDFATQEEQTKFNLKRWKELERDPFLANVQARIETDRHGHIIMSPYAGFHHGSYQSRITSLLALLLPHGRSVTECPISTQAGVKLADVAWISHARLAEIGENVCLTKAPEICVEILSPCNTKREMAEKKTFYFLAGACEVWFCDRKGKVTFFLAPTSIGETASHLCPEFPAHVTF